MKRRTQPTTWIAAVLCVTWACTADAAGKRGSKVDGNQDGTVSADELAKTFDRGQGLRDQVFTRLDTDADGRVSRAEFNNNKTFNRADASRDGYLTRKEFHAWRAQVVASGAQGIDRDGDRTITAQELGTSWDRGKAERERRRAESRRAWESRDKVDVDRDGQVTSSEALARYNRGRQGRIELFRNLDADHNKTLSREEFPSPEVFAKVDDNHDNRINQKEFLAAHAIVTAAVFDELDADHDQVITPEEFKRLLQRNR